MTKIDGRTKKAAARQIDESLKRLQTDHLDLLQFHEIIRLEDPDRIFADGAHRGGAGRPAGGQDPLHRLYRPQGPAGTPANAGGGRRHDFRFDAVQMPLNVMDAHFRSFGRQVVPLLVKEEIGVLGMKPMANGIILKSNPVTPVECLHYAMSLPTSTVITGIDSMEILRQDLDAVRSFKPLDAEQTAAMLQRTAAAASEGQYEPFKTTNHFDGTAHNPQWLG